MIDQDKTISLCAEYKAAWKAVRENKTKKGDKALFTAALADIAAIAPLQQSAAQDITGYDRYIVAFSGGKDSLALPLWLIDQGIDPALIELHHHDVDGREGSQAFDWPVTRSYCEAIADHLGLPLTYSWRVGGIEGEILKENAPTAPIKFTTLSGDVISLTTTSRPNTRLMFPAIAADLRTRWCSSLAKIDVFRLWLNNEPRFIGKKILVLTGERAQESAGRATYNYAEMHHCHSGRKTVHALRPILHWEESKVWDLIKKHNINPHPAYHLGFSRVSCAMCIFNGKNEFATSALVAAAQFKRLCDIEEEINFTMKHKTALADYAREGKGFATSDCGTQDRVYRDSITGFSMPSGAFKNSSCGSV